MLKRYKAPHFLRSETGTIAPLVAGYLSLLLLVSISAANVVSAMVFSNRIQGVVDSAVVYGHERSLRVGIPQPATLKAEITKFLQTAPSARGLEVESFSATTLGSKSELELCATVNLPVSPRRVLICKRSSAQSYLTQP